MHILSGCTVCDVCKDTDEGGGEDGEDRADGNGALSVLQISGAVRSRHDSCHTEEMMSISVVT